VNSAFKARHSATYANDKMSQTATRVRRVMNFQIRAGLLSRLKKPMAMAKIGMI
jgi:hypothetical protein